MEALIQRFIKKIQLGNHPFNVKFPPFSSFLLHLTPAVSGEIFGKKHRLPLSRMFYPTLVVVVVVVGGRGV